MLPSRLTPRYRYKRFAAIDAAEWACVGFVPFGTNRRQLPPRQCKFRRANRTMRGTPPPLLGSPAGARPAGL